MRMATGRVVDGRVELPKDAFEEGELVTVLADDGGTFELTPEQERVLEERIAEADLGERATWTEVIEECARRRRQREILALSGTIDYVEGYDHKAERRRDRALP